LQYLYSYMHDIAASHCTNVDESATVLTVPLGYSQEQRETVKQCATDAGFRVVQVVSEPVAACLAHAVEQNQDRRYVLVYRIGGSTMSATLILVSGGCYSVLDSSQCRLGGDEVTDVLVNYLGKEFKNKYKEDILTNKRGRAKLTMEAEKCKHVLSTLDTAHCYVESLFDGMDFSTNVTRARFDNELSKVVSELLSPISDLLTRCNLETSDISNVILAGGTTKVVKIQKQLSSMFSKAEISLNISPDESIAIGAAVQASFLTKETNLNGSQSMLSISRDIVVKCDQIESGQTVVVHSDATVPLRKSVPLTVVTKDCKEIQLKILFGLDISLASLTLPIEETSKLTLGVHIHRDGSTHFTLTDKNNGKSVDALLKQS